MQADTSTLNHLHVMHDGLNEVYFLKLYWEMFESSGIIFFLPITTNSILRIFKNFYLLIFTR